MSSEISYVPIIPPKTTEEIIHEYYDKISELKRKNDLLQINRDEIKKTIENVNKQIVAVGRNEEKNYLSIQRVNKSFVAEFNNIKTEDNNLTYMKQQDGAIWDFQRNLKEELNECIANIKNGIFKTKRHAEEARDLLQMLERFEIEPNEAKKRIRDNIDILSREELDIVKEYTMIQMMKGNDSVFSYEEAVQNIEYARQSVGKILVSNYQKHIVQEACEHVGIKLASEISKNRFSYSVNGIDNCEVEMTFFDHGEIMIETIGIIDAHIQQSKEQKRQCVTDSKIICDKISEMQNYISSVYPNVQFIIERAMGPTEENLKMIVKDDFNNNRKKHKKKYLRLDNG